MSKVIDKQSNNVTNVDGNWWLLIMSHIHDVDVVIVSQKSNIFFKKRLKTMKIWTTGVEGCLQGPRSENVTRLDFNFSGRFQQAGWHLFHSIAGIVGEALNVDEESLQGKIPPSLQAMNAP